MSTEIDFYLDDAEPWLRMPTESNQAFAAFQAYAALGPGRSILEAYRRAVDPNAKRASGRWKVWSGKWAWVARAEAFDRDMVNAKLQEARGIVGDGEGIKQQRIDRLRQLLDESGETFTESLGALKLALRDVDEATARRMILSGGLAKVMGEAVNGIDVATKGLRLETAEAERVDKLTGGGGDGNGDERTAAAKLDGIEEDSLSLVRDIAAVLRDIKFPGGVVEGQVVEDEVAGEVVQVDGPAELPEGTDDGTVINIWGGQRGPERSSVPARSEDREAPLE